MSEGCYFGKTLSNEITNLKDAGKRLEKEDNNPFC